MAAISKPKGNLSQMKKIFLVAIAATTLRLLSNVVRERAHTFYTRLGYDVLKTEYVFQKNL